MTDEDIVGAALRPGFGPNPAAWRLNITRDRVLRQEVRIWKCPVEEHRSEQVELRPEEIGTILSTAERIGFRNFPDSYEHKVTDQETLTIALRLSDGLKTVEAYAPMWLAACENNSDTTNFLELWACIHQRAPFPSAYNDPQRIVAVLRNQRLTVTRAGLGGGS